jgi:oligoribonuclease NrnB/cAMP/cGMP phosphodiesterase (DHH superfamily)
VWKGSGIVMNLCIHHGDLDGTVSGATVKSKVPCTLHPANYGDLVPWNLIDTAETVYIVDFSYDVEDMKKIINKTHTVWIDHHKTAIEKMGDIYVEGIRGDKAGCELTWEYFYDTPMPDVVKFVGDRDIWKFSYQETRPYCASLSVKDLPAYSEWYQTLLTTNEYTPAIIYEGEIIEKVRKFDRNKAISSLGYETTFEGYKTLFINTPGYGELGEEIRNQGYDIAYCYVDTLVNERLVRRVSLYSNVVDVSELAKKRGGGGHKGAAGFTIELGDIRQYLDNIVLS